MSEAQFVEVDGFEAKQDLTSLSEDDLSHGIINHVIHLAHLRNTSIEAVLEALLMSHIFVRSVARIVSKGDFPDDLPMV